MSHYLAVVKCVYALLRISKSISFDRLLSYSILFSGLFRYYVQRNRLFWLDDEDCFRLRLVFPRLNFDFVCPLPFFVGRIMSQ